MGSETSASLLERLKQPQDEAAWVRFVQLYTPLIYYWARRVGCPSQDAADLVQDVFGLLLKKLPHFQYDQSKSFRSWLRRVTLNRWREGRRRRDPIGITSEPGTLDQIAAKQSEAFWETEYRKHLVDQALVILQAEFRPATWNAFSGHVISGRPAAEVADELGVTVDAIYAAKARVLRRLRRELDGLLD